MSRMPSQPAQPAERPDETDGDRPRDRRRDRLRHEARRAILDATEALLVEDGYERFSMRRLAGRCDVAAPTLYHYFADKAALLDTLLEERFELLRALLADVPGSGANDPVEALRSRALRFVGFGLEHPTHYRLLMTPRSEPAPPARSAEQARELMESPLRELADGGRLASASLETAMQAFWALCHGLISLQSSRPGEGWSPELVETALDALIRGLVGDVRPRTQETA